MREIRSENITLKVKQLILDASCNAPADLLAKLQECLENETSPAGKYVLETIIENNRVARKEQIAICQDTGLAVIFAYLGQDVNIRGGLFKDAVNEGVRQAYEEGFLRKSIVDDPVFDRKNTGTNTPAVIYTDIVAGDKIHFKVMPKGFGSENMSALGMLTPAHGSKGIVELIVETVRKAGPNPCPPTIIGVGIGGTADMAMVTAKKALCRKIGEHNPDKRYQAMEKEALEKINCLGIGPAGLGGNTTSLAVNIDYLPTHIAGMPVAINICCHASRHSEGSI